MNKPCAKCNRVVYSMEQLKCLDQVWHKGCFNCDVCNTKLTMKNYKGYDKRPYCNAHYPTTKFTQVADNPEMRRVKANTKTISNIEYHKDLEEQRGKKISVESDPLIDKAKKNTKIQSNLVYHGHEQTRELENANRPVEKGKQPAKVVHRETSPVQKPKQLDDTTTYDHQSSSPPAVPSTIAPPAAEPIAVVPDDPTPPPDPTTNGTSSHDPDSVEPEPVEPEPVEPESVDPDPVDPDPVDPDPVKSQFSDEPNVPPPSENPAEPAEYNPMRDLQEAHQPAVGGYGHAGGYPVQGSTKYIALYDYTAADHDEVSFAEGDFIINPEIIDDGWMTGTVESTGRTGMLPSNYVEKA